MIVSILIGFLLIAAALYPFARILYARWRDDTEIDAQELAAVGRYREAVRLLRSLYDQGKVTPTLLKHLALYLCEIGELEPAIKAIEEAEVRFGFSRELTVIEAFLLVRLGRGMEARGLFDSLIQANPRDIEVIYQHACLLLQMGLPDEAEREYELAEMLFLRETSEERRAPWRQKLALLRQQIDLRV